MLGNFQRRTVSLFTAYARQLYRHPRRSLGWLVPLFLVGALPLLWLRIDSSNEGYLKKSDRALQTYQQFQAEFGAAEPIFLAIRAEKPFSEGFLQKLQDFTSAIRQIPYVERIDSLLNAHYPDGSAGTLAVRDYLPEEIWPDEHKLRQARERLRRDESYADSILSADPHYTAVIIYPTIATAGETVPEWDNFAAEDFPQLGVATSPDSPAVPVASSAGARNAAARNAAARNAAARNVAMALEPLLQEYQGPDFAISASGSPLLISRVEQELASSLTRFSLLSFVAVLAVLWLLFGSWTYVLTAALIVLATLSGTLGLMALAGVAVTLPTQALPPFLLVIATGDAVHLLSLIRDARPEHSQARRNGNRQALENRMQGSIAQALLPCMLTTLTTGLGFLSFVSASIAPVAQLGIFASIGVVLAFFWTYSAIPLCLALLPFPTKPPANAALWPRLARRLAHFVARYSWAIIACFLLLLLGGIWAASQVRFGHNPLSWFPASSALRRSNALIEQKFQGSIAINMLLETGTEGGALEPELLRTNQASTQSFVAQQDGRASAQSLVPIAKSIHRALLQEESAYTIADSQKAIAQELTLYESAEPRQLEDFLNFAKSGLQTTIRLPWRDSSRFVAAAENLAAAGADLKKWGKLIVTGESTLMARIFSQTIASTWRSYLFSILTISLVLVLSSGRIRWGLLVLLPNFLPLLFILGTLGLLGIPLDLFNMLAISIVIGLAVDDTIHILHGYRAQSAAGREGFILASQRIFASSGKAILLTSVILIMGFSVLQISYLNNFKTFSLLCSGAILLALIADLLLLPALLYRFGQSQGHPRCSQKHKI